MTHVTCRLTAKNQDQLGNPTLGNRVCATLPFYRQTARRTRDNVDVGAAPEEISAAPVERLTNESKCTVSTRLELLRQRHLVRRRAAHNTTHDTRCDTIRDAVSTCAQKLTRVSLIYRTEPTSKSGKQKKTKSKKTDMLRGVGIRVCLCLSVTSRGILSKRMNESSWFWALELPSTRPTLCSKKIRVSPKIRVLPSGTLSQTPDLENFASAYRSSKRVMCYQLSSTT